MLVAFILSSNDAIISPCLRGPALRCSSSFDSFSDRNKPAVGGVAGVCGVDLSAVETGAPFTRTTQESLLQFVNTRDKKKGPPVKASLGKAGAGVT